MSAVPYEKVVVVGGSGGNGTPVSVQIDVTAGPVEVEVVNDQPIEVAITQVDEGVVINANSNGQSTQNYFIDADGTSLELKTAFAAPATSGDNEIVNQVTGKKIRVIGYTLQGKGTVSAHFRSGSTPKSMTWDFQAREGVVVAPRADVFLFETAVNTDLNLNLSDSVGVNVQVWYIEVS